MSVIVYESELYHHGVLGQKWGVRRYQNADGSLTKQGQKHYSENKVTINSNVPYNQSELTKFQKYDSVLPKGTKLYRVTSEKNESKNGRKYASFLRDDRDLYEYDSQLFPGKYLVEYTLKKDMNIAGGVSAFNARLETNSNLSNFKVKDAMNSDKNIQDFNNVFNNVKNLSVNEAWNKISENPKNVSDFIDMFRINGKYDTLETVKNNEINNSYYKKLKDKGYDAALDMADSLPGYARYPIVIVNNDAYDVTNVVDMEKRKGGRPSYF